MLKPLSAIVILMMIAINALADTKANELESRVAVLEARVKLLEAFIIQSTEEAEEEKAESKKQTEAEAKQQAEAREQAALSDALVYVRDEISKNWKLPAGARNGMLVEVMIRLAPSGEIISVEVVTRNATDTMVESVKDALRKVERFDKLAQLDAHLFDANFRKFRISFRPEDFRP